MYTEKEHLIEGIRDVIHVVRDNFLNFTITKDKFLYILTICYFFMSPFGNVFRFDSGGKSLGIGSIILLLVVLLTVLRTIFLFYENIIWSSFFLLICWLSFSSFFGDIKAGYVALSHLAMYILFAMGVSTIKFTPRRVEKLLFVTMLSMFISATLNLIDFSGIIDIPIFNEFTQGIDLGNDGIIIGAAGPFSLRSAMASYYGLLIPLILVYGILAKKKSIKYLSFLVFLVGMISIAITFNRSGPFAIIIVTLIFLFFGTKNSIVRLKSIVFVTMVIIAGYLILNVHFPSQMRAIKYKINLLFEIGNYSKEHAIEQRESDHLRLFVTKEAVRKIVDNPFGYGLTRIEIPENGEKINPHNNITQIIYSAGVFGFFWLIFFGFKLYKIFSYKLRGSYCVYGRCIKYGLFGWFLVSMTHTNWATGVAWALLGILMMIYKKERLLPINHPLTTNK